MRRSALLAALLGGWLAVAVRGEAPLDVCEESATGLSGDQLAVVCYAGNFLEKMLTELEKEHKDDFDYKDGCSEETFKNEQEASCYEYKIEKLNDQIANLRAHVEELEVARTSTNERSRRRTIPSRRTRR